MADASTPITIPLSPFQKARFAALDAEAQRLSVGLERLNGLKREAATALLGLATGLEDFPNWQLGFTPEAIIAAPPVEDAAP